MCQILMLFIFNFFEQWTFRNCKSFGTIQFQNMQRVHKVTRGKAFSHVFGWIWGVWSNNFPRVHRCCTTIFLLSILPTMTNQYTNYNFVTTVCSYFKSTFSIFFHTKNVAKLICQILMSCALTSHIVTYSANHIVEDNMNTYGIHLQQCITRTFI